MKTLTLTEDEIHGLIEAVDRGLDDRQDYMQNGNPHIDYGEEWPEIAREQARRWRNCAIAVRAIGAGEFETMAGACEALSSSLDASATEFGQ